MCFDSSVAVVIRLDDDTCQYLQTSAIDCEEDFKQDTDAFVAAAAEAALTLEETDLARQLKNFATGSRKFLLIQCLPEDPMVPPTPTDGRKSIGKETAVHEFVQAVMLSLIGAKPAVYEWQSLYSHPMFHEGFPTPPHRKARSSPVAAVSNGKTLPYHLDLEGLRSIQSAPEFLCLGCIREGGDDSIVTKVIDNKDVLDLMAESDQEILRKPRFLVPNKTKALDWPNIPQPIISEDESDASKGPTILTMVDGPNAIMPAAKDDDEAWRALSSLQDAIQQVNDYGVAHKIHFRAGELLILKNREVLHSREASQPPKFDGNDRILIRSYWMGKDTTAPMCGNNVLWTCGVN